MNELKPHIFFIGKPRFGELSKPAVFQAGKKYSLGAYGSKTAVPNY